MQESTPKLCLACRKPVRGRSDKKFCNDYCRNGYNNMQKAPSNNFVRNCNNSLLKNRRILADCTMENSNYTIAGKNELTRRGFDFDFVTQVVQNRQGSRFYFCYDYGYFPLCEEEFVLFSKEKI